MLKVPEKMTQQTWLKQYQSSLTGKTVVITGATGGIGTELCKVVLFCGGAAVLLCRNAEKAEALRASLLREFPEGKVSCLMADLTDMISVRAAVESLKSMPVDLLIHNAGVYDIPRETCFTGYNNIFQINFISPYYITKKLLPILRQRHGKVIAVGSIAHNYSQTDPKDLDFSFRNACSLVYGNSKRYLMFAFSELMRDSGVEFAIAHPGITLTNISAHYPKLIFAIIKHPMKVIFMKPAKAARSIILAMFASVPNLSWIGPKYFNIWGNPSVKKLTTCSAPEQSRIFAAAESIYAGIVRNENGSNF